MNIFDKILGKKVVMDEIDAVSMVACIGKLADELRVDGDERVRMFRRGLSRYPELVSSLPIIDDHIDLFADDKWEAVGEPTENKDNSDNDIDDEKKDHDEKVLNMLEDTVSRRVNLIIENACFNKRQNNKINDGKFYSFTKSCQIYGLASANAKLNITCKKMIIAARELGYLVGGDELLKFDFSYLNLTEKGLKCFKVENSSLLWSSDKFIELYKELANKILIELK